jgi:hypothetical protein
MAHNLLRATRQALAKAHESALLPDQSLKENGADIGGTDKSLRKVQGRFRHNEMLRQELTMKKARKNMMERGGLMRRVFGIGKQQGGLPGSKLIHPFSPFAQGLMLTSGILLTYSAIVSSFMVGILWNADTCEKLLLQEFDMFVDCFFIVEIILHFCTGITHYGEYCDDLKVVAVEYVRGALAFDIVTSIPVSFFEIEDLLTCRAIGTEVPVDNNAFRFVRVLKPLKIARILRTLKLMKMLKVFSIVGDYFRVPPFLARTVKIIVFILLLVHATACTFWLVKEVTNTPEQMARFLASQGFPGDSPETAATPFHKYVTREMCNEHPRMKGLTCWKPNQVRDRLLLCQHRLLHHRLRRHLRHRRLARAPAGIAARFWRVLLVNMDASKIV